MVGGASGGPTGRTGEDGFDFLIILNSRRKYWGGGKVAQSLKKSCERTHSKVKLSVRAAMLPENLEDLIQISIESDIADKIELGKLVEVFKLAKHRKIPL